MDVRSGEHAFRWEPGTLILLQDYQGLSIRLTEERLAHIREHPEMRGLLPEMKRTLLEPACVVRSSSDNEANLYYRYYLGTVAGAKYLCVVVKVQPGDAFVLTAYLTDKVKQGDLIWPTGE